MGGDDDERARGWAVTAGCARMLDSLGLPPTRPRRQWKQGHKTLCDSPSASAPTTGAKGLRRAIESALDQDVDDLEVVVSDDSGDSRSRRRRRGRARPLHRNPGRTARSRTSGTSAPWPAASTSWCSTTTTGSCPDFLSRAGAPMDRDEPSASSSPASCARRGAGGGPTRSPCRPGRSRDPAADGPRRPPARSLGDARSAGRPWSRARPTFPLLDGHIGDLTTWIRPPSPGGGSGRCPSRSRSSRSTAGSSRPARIPRA